MSDTERLARRVADQYGVEPVPGYRVQGATLALPIVGRTLGQVTVGIGTYLILRFVGHPAYMLEVEGPSTAKGNQGSEGLRITSRAGPFDAVLVLLGQVVAAATATEDGALSVRFANGGEFTVDAPDGYETWQLHDAESDYLLVTHAGGGLVQFGSTPHDIRER
jgi:hypothetical protein